MGGLPRPAPHGSIWLRVIDAILQPAVTTPTGLVH